MMHPEMRYELARVEQEARMVAAQQRHEARAARRAQRQEQGSWLSAVMARFHRSAPAPVLALELRDQSGVAVATPDEALAA